MAIVWLALAITLVAETPIVAAFYPGHRLRMALACAVATTATNLALNFTLLHARLPYDPTLLVGETGALVFEAVVYALLAPRRDWPRAIAASAAANFASFALGLILF